MGCPRRLGKVIYPKITFNNSLTEVGDNVSLYPVADVGWAG